MSPLIGFTKGVGRMLATPEGFTAAAGSGLLGTAWLLDKNKKQPSAPVTQQTETPAPPAPPAAPTPPVPSDPSNSFSELLKRYQADYETSQAVIAQQNLQYQQNFDRQQREFENTLAMEKKRLFENSKRTSGGFFGAPTRRSFLEGVG